CFALVPPFWYSRLFGTVVAGAHSVPLGDIPSAFDRPSTLCPRGFVAVPSGNDMGGDLAPRHLWRLPAELLQRAPHRRLPANPNRCVGYPIVTAGRRVACQWTATSC